MQNNFQLIKNIFINFILILIASVFSIFLLELFVISFLPQFDPRGMVAYQVNDEGVPLLKNKNQSMRQWKNTGDYDVSVFSNELGLRNHKDIKTNYVDAIYVVGDSYSFGQGVEENERYSDQLEGLINKPIINISIPTDFQGYDRLINYAIKNGANIEELIRDLILQIGEDPEREGLLKTPERVAKAWNFLSNGYEQDLDSIINNAIFRESYDEMVAVKDIDFFNKILIIFMK